jgi:uncharacterized membrane protein YhaH (DUF805 family)
MNLCCRCRTNGQQENIMADTFIPSIDPAPSLRGRLATLFMFNGRIGRGHYWMLSGLYVGALALGMAAFMAAGIMLDAKPSDALMPVFVLIGMVFFAAMAVANVSIGVRRLHDRGKSGYWLVLYYALPSMAVKGAGLTGPEAVYLLATLGVIVWSVIDLGILRGDKGSNAFGPDPLAK